MTARRAFTAAAAFVLPALGLAFAPSRAAASDSAPLETVDFGLEHGMTDTTYGRMDGDLGVVVGAGASFGARAPRIAVDTRLRYLDTAGVFAGYEDGATFGLDAQPARVIPLGFELRPLFLARWALGLELGRPRLDLFIDSFGLELGIVFSQPVGGSFAATPGFQASLGLEFPITGSASGLWLDVHGGMRWSNAEMQKVPVDNASGQSLFLQVTLAWHQIVRAHLVGGDGAGR